MTLKKNEKKLRKKIIAIAKDMISNGMDHGTTGNISVRISNGIIITPTSVPY